MAEWGKGDPRWIVEERPDATNVNNWHWTERNASYWSKDKIKELFTNLKIDDEVGSCEIIEVEKIEGDASANNRKAKLIFFFEWNIEMKWKGYVKGSDYEVEGKIEIPNLSEENDPEDVDVNVSTKVDSNDAYQLKEMLCKRGIKVIRDKVAQYAKELREEFSVGMILPSKDNALNSKTPGQTSSNDINLIGSSGKASINSQCKTMADSVAGIKKLDVSGVKINTSKLTLKESFKCTAEELYNALTIKEMVQAFTQGSCKLEPEKGGSFELFGGNVSGVFVELIPCKLIVQRWRFKSWPEGHFSEVKLMFDQKDDCTLVSLSQTGIPTNDFEKTQNGWRTYYWESMKKTFGFGSHLL